MTTREEISRLVAKLREAYDHDDDTELGAALEALEVALVRADDDLAETEDEPEDDEPVSPVLEPDKPDGA
jgi:hypothetical protein